MRQGGAGARPWLARAESRVPACGLDSSRLVGSGRVPAPVMVGGCACGASVYKVSVPRRGD